MKITDKTDADRLCSLLDGKGGGKGTRFNAKINSFKKISEVDALLKTLVGV